MARRSDLNPQQIQSPQVQQAPYVDPGLSPDLAYRAAAAARQKARNQSPLPKTSDLVAGGAGPAVPPLNGPHHAGMTMQQQAEFGRNAGQGVQPGGGIAEPAFQSAGDAPPPQNMDLRPGDMLTPEASKDPGYMQGQGSAYAAAQPMLAAKYGVLRDGQLVPPQALSRQARTAAGTNEPKPQLRAETIRDLEMLQKLQQQQSADTPVGTLHATENEAVGAHTSTAAGTIGNEPGDDDSEPLTDEERKDLKDDLKNLNEFDYDAFRQAMMKDILNNPEQRDIIESRLAELDLEELILTNRVKQRVDIIPGKISFTYQSMTAEEDLAIKRLVMEESQTVDVSDRYMLDKYSMMSIVCGLIEINGKPFGGGLGDSDGKFSDDKFQAKFNRVMKLPLHMLAAVGLNQTWFEMRVRKLFVAEKVGNG